MSEDLRRQVVEAMARAYEQSGYDSISNDEITDETWEHIKTNYPDAYAEMLRDSGAALDAVLDTLTDNAEAWILAGHRAGDLDDGMHRGDHALVDPLIDALRSPTSKTRTGDS